MEMSWHNSLKGRVLEGIEDTDLWLGRGMGDQCVLLHVHECVHTLAPMSAELVSYLGLSTKCFSFSFSFSVHSDSLQSVEWSKAR